MGIILKHVFIFYLRLTNGKPSMEHKYKTKASQVVGAQSYILLSKVPIVIVVTMFSLYIFTTLRNPRQLGYPLGWYTCFFFFKSLTDHNNVFKGLKIYLKINRIRLELAYILLTDKGTVISPVLYLTYLCIFMFNIIWQTPY